MKKLFAWVAMAVCVAFTGEVLAQDKAADKPAASAEAKKEEAKPAAAPAPTPNKGDVTWMLQAGQYTYTADHRPLLGPSDVPGLVLNVGYSGHGIMASGAGGRIVVDALLGRLAPEDNPFRPQRTMVERPLDIL